MDMLRAAAARLAEWATRSGPLTKLRAFLPAMPQTDDGQRGQGLAEYALILALIAIVAVASLIFLGESIVGTFTEIINSGFKTVTDLIGLGG